MDKEEEKELWEVLENSQREVEEEKEEALEWLNIQEEVRKSAEKQERDLQDCEEDMDISIWDYEVLMADMDITCQ